MSSTSGLRTSRLEVVFVIIITDRPSYTVVDCRRPNFSGLEPTTTPSQIGTAPSPPSFLAVVWRHIFSAVRFPVTFCIVPVKWPVSLSEDILNAFVTYLRNKPARIWLYVRTDWQSVVDARCTGTMNWVQKMKRWSKLDEYNEANRTWFVNDVSKDTEMYVKETDRFHFYWVLGGGHSVGNAAGESPTFQYDSVNSCNDLYAQCLGHRESELISDQILYLDFVIDRFFFVKLFKINNKQLRLRLLLICLSTVAHSKLINHQKLCFDFVICVLILFVYFWFYMNMMIDIVL